MRRGSGLAGTGSGIAAAHAETCARPSANRKGGRARSPFPLQTDGREQLALSSGIQQNPRETGYAHRSGSLPPKELRPGPLPQDSGLA
jgi:hypothetical protein